MKREIHGVFGRRVGELARLWRGAIDRELRPVGLSFMQWLTLSQLAESGADLVQKDLAARMAVEGSAMVAILDRLVTADLVERRVSATDRRANTVHLTSTGHAMLGNAELAMDAVRGRLLADLDESALVETGAVLEHIIERARGS
ncbi:MAG: MarR family transcriptional regulator [Chromatiales bacterium]|nr:MarR family transcriptional regulator [Chromatiales bacterium]